MLATLRAGLATIFERLPLCYLLPVLLVPDVLIVVPLERSGRHFLCPRRHRLRERVTVRKRLQPEQA
eukprot:scaffold1371_cov400-Prasinococcus_capsulatus_cf.AAC.2